MNAPSKNPIRLVFSLVLWGLMPLALAEVPLAINGTSATQCDSNGLCTIERSLTSDFGISRQIPYSFRFRAPKPGAPTVVVIPGGPGQTSTDQDVAKSKSIPDDFGILQTDPRFTGVNEHPDFNQFRNSMTSAGVAGDIVLALEAVKVRKPILFGTSYGTVVATILAHTLCQKPETAPHAVILD